MINQKLRLEIEDTFTVSDEKSTDEELVFCCPECGDATGHRSLNLKTGLTFCFRCNKGANNNGNFFAWAKALGYEFSQDSFDSGPTLEELLNPAPVKSIVPVVKPTELPAGFTPIERDPKNVYSRLIAKMAVRKRLTFDDFVEAGAGYTETGIWEPYCIFPVFEYGLTVYYQGRTYVDDPDEPTKKFPSRKTVEYGAAYWVYNIDEVRETKPKIVIIVESILNVLSLRKKIRQLGLSHKYVPVCVFKHFVSKVQTLKLLRCDYVQEFCFLFDHDAIDKTWDMVEEFCNLAKISIAEMPTINGNRKADANDDVDVAWQAIRARKVYTMAERINRTFEKALITGVDNPHNVREIRICS